MKGALETMIKFSIGPEIIYGDDALGYLEHIKGKQILIVTDPSMVKLGIVHAIEEKIKKTGIAYQIFSEVEPDPSMDVVKKGISVFMKAKADHLIAVGGGSAIDVAKAVLYFSIQIQDQLVEGEHSPKPTFIAIPTTSGTGSEVTSYSVVTDTANEVKIPLTDKMMIPDVAILDEKLTETVPPKVTADTGMDVLTHAMEALVSKKSSILTDMFAEKSIKLVFTYLPRAFRYGNDLQARRKLHIASCLAGIAFENASLGINHSLAHSLGAKFHISHGRSNALLLPYVIAYNAGFSDGSIKHSEAAQKYAMAAKWIGSSAESTEEAVKYLINEILKFNQLLSIPTSLHKMLIDKNRFEKNLPSMAKAALNDVCTTGNPKAVCEKSLTGILKSAY